MKNIRIKLPGYKSRDEMQEIVDWFDDTFGGTGQGQPMMFLGIDHPRYYIKTLFFREEDAVLFKMMWCT